MSWSILTVTEADSEQYQHLITKLFSHYLSFLHNGNYFCASKQEPMELN